MKNLYFIIAMLCASGVCAQDLQNANWIYNDIRLQFPGIATPNALNTISGGSYTTLEGCASVSDTSGGLLFFTDGFNVYHLVGSTITPFGGNANSPSDALNGHRSSAQNVIIIPKPGNPDHYYIVTLVGATSSPYPTGLYFNEVDVSTNSYVTQNNVLTNGTNNIDDNYGNISEALTSVLAQDGINYWLIVHLENATDSNIYTFSVTGSGITLAQTYAMPLNTNVSYSLKVSPDRSRLSLCEHGVNPILGTLDNATGAVTFNTTPVGAALTNIYCYSADFSPDSQNLYYTRRDEGVFGVSVANPSVEEQVDDEPLAYGVQRALNRRVYVAIKGARSIGEINDPNDLANAAANYNLVTWTASGTDMLSPGAIPQWIWSTCIATLEDYNDITSVELREEEREQWIRNYNFVNIGGRGIYHAGNFVEMLPGFEADYGADYVAYIEGCSQDFQYRPGAAQPKGHSQASPIKGIKIHPNPTHNILNISIENQDMTGINILAVDGKMVYSQAASGNEQQIDVSRLANGVYLVVVQTVGGKALTRKFVKN